MDVEQINNGTLRARIIWMAGTLVVLNGAAWTWAFLAFWHAPVLLGTALLAYGLGLRHAIDADHIAAIDNVTRKLMRGGKRPVAVGFFFAIGHSSVVIIASFLVAVTSPALRHRLDLLHGYGALIGTLVSASFLLAVAAMNLVLLVSIVRGIRRIKSGGGADHEVQVMLRGSGVLIRVLRPLFRLTSESWHMIPLGFLFGLGFDTATEIGLLGLSASQATHGLPIVFIMVFPALFTASMSLVDAADSMVMLKAYGWALAQPIRRFYYNLALTLGSVIVAAVIGCVELCGLIPDFPVLVSLVVAAFLIVGAAWATAYCSNKKFHVRAGNDRARPSSADYAD